MTKLEKLKKPKILEENEEKWTKEYLKDIENCIKNSCNNYNNKEIKYILKKETYEKCAYCESKLNAITFGDIEHILPKNENARPDLCYSWENLTLACEICNRSGKKDYYNENLLLINPYVDNPEKFFIEIGEIMYPKDGNQRAELSIAILNLNRAGLIEGRKERIKSIENLFMRWAKEKDTNLKGIIEQQLKKEYQNDAEYSSTVRSF